MNKLNRFKVQDCLLEFAANGRLHNQGCNDIKFNLAVIVTKIITVIIIIAIFPQKLSTYVQKAMMVQYKLEQFQKCPTALTEAQLHCFSAYLKHCKHAVLFEVLNICTQVEVQLLHRKMTQVKVESALFTFYSIESIKVHKMVYTFI